MSATAEQMMPFDDSPAAIQGAVYAPERVLFTADDISKMVELEIIDPDLRFELIDGELILMSPAHVAHDKIRRRLYDALSQQIGMDNAYCCPEGTMRVSDLNVLVPDIFILSEEPPDADGYLIPQKEHLLFVAEVSARDRRKIKKYATAGFPEYWIVDVARKKVTVYRGPDSGDGAYREMKEHSTGNIAPLAFPKVLIDLERLFAPNRKTK